MRAAEHDAGAAISDWIEIQFVYLPAVIISPRAWLPHSLGEGAHISHTCSVAPDPGDFEDFAKQEEDDLKKTDEAKKRMDAILKKHMQRQLQKQRKGPLPCLHSIEVTSLDRDAAAIEVKDVD